MPLLNDTEGSEEIAAVLGPHAKATGRLRVLTDGVTGRLQYEWVGYGLAWFDVPNVRVATLPPRRGDNT